LIFFPWFMIINILFLSTALLVKSWAEALSK
jgi:hypothetical protein